MAQCIVHPWPAINLVFEDISACSIASFFQFRMKCDLESRAGRKVFFKGNSNEQRALAQLLFNDHRGKPLLQNFEGN